jgi:hypothetical protein
MELVSGGEARVNLCDRIGSSRSREASLHWDPDQQPMSSEKSGYSGHFTSLGTCKPPRRQRHYNSTNHHCTTLIPTKVTTKGTDQDRYQGIETDFSVIHWYGAATCSHSTCLASHKLSHVVNYGIADSRVLVPHPNCNIPSPSQYYNLLAFQSSSVPAERVEAK